MFVGPENIDDKQNPFDFNQWYFFEPQNDKEVKMGDWNMDENYYATIQWDGWQPNIFENWKHSNNQMIHFELNGGNPNVPENHYDSDLLKENPHTEKMKLLAIENKNVERGLDEPNLSADLLGEPGIETTLVHYTPTLSHEDSPKEYFDSNYPEYFSFTRKFMADVKMGRWNKKDSLEQKITVDDTILPAVNAPEDVSAGYNANMGIERMGAATATDDSPYPLSMWYEDQIISEDTNYKVIERTHFAKDVRGNIGSDKQKITLDLSTGTQKISSGNKGIDIDVWGNNKLRVSTEKYMKNGQIHVFNMKGQAVDVIEVNDLLPNEDRIINLTNSSKFKKGIYIVSFHTNEGQNKNVIFSQR